MAAWTTPHTATTGEVTTAGQWNAEVRDNPTFLYEALAGEPFVTFSERITDYAVGGANQAQLCLLTIPRKIVVTAVRFSVGVSSGNIDVGLYDASFNRLWSRGSVACPSAGAASISIGAGSPTTLTLTPAIYWFAIAADGTTATFRGRNDTVTGIAKLKASSFPLPNPITSPSDTTSTLAIQGWVFP